MEKLELVQYALIKYYLIKDDESEIYIGCAETKEYSEILKLFTIMKNNDIECHFNENSRYINLKDSHDFPLLINDIDIQLPTKEDLLVINIYLE